MSYLDRVAGTTTSTGTGNLTIASLLGFVSPCAAFAPSTSGVTLCVVDSTTGAWEVSSCTIVDGTTVSRNTLISSSTGSAINFAAGTKSVFHDVPASVINDLLTNRPLQGAVISSGITVADDYLPVIQSGALKRITVENFLADIGTATPGLSAAGALSGADMFAVTQDGINEVRTTLSDIVDYVASALSGTASAAINATTANNTTTMSATGYTATSSASISATTDSPTFSMSATGPTSSGTSSISATTADTTSSMSASVGTTYTITGYAGNTVNATSDYAAAQVAAPLTYKYTNALMANGYWNISPSPASARCGWGTSNSTPPAEITLGANQSSGSSVNGMVPMGHPGAWSAEGYLWVTDGSGSSTWYFWVKPVDGVAQCMNPSGMVVNNA